MYKLLFTIVLCFIVTAVFCFKGKGISLSGFQKWPDSLSIQMYYSAGILHGTSTIYISKDNCYIEDNSPQDNSVKRKNFKLTQYELDKLLADLKKNNIDKLNIKKLSYTQHDAGVQGLTISLGHRNINISNGATQEISEKNSGDFSKCLNILNKIAQGKTADRK